MGDEATVNQRIRIGMLTPSSNTVLEAYTAAMVSAYGESVSVHFSRFRVTEISPSSASQAQFAEEPILAAARLLGDAKCHAIAWNGTSAGWLGFDRDVRLCRLIEDETGIPATSSMLALNQFLAAVGAKTIGLVTPYLNEIQQCIIANYHDIGIEVVAERRLEDPGNFSFAEYEPSVIEAMIRDVAVARPDAIAVICTNFRGAPVAGHLEEEIDITIVDSVAAAVWGAARLAGLDTRCIKGWGRFFEVSADSTPEPPAARELYA